jgi:hypothetical protein
MMLKLPVFVIHKDAALVGFAYWIIRTRPKTGFMYINSEKLIYKYIEGMCKSITK